MISLDFRSDNVTGAAPEIIQALAEANSGPAAAYGDDAWTQRLEGRFAELFEREVAVFPLATGSAANALALSAISPPWGAVYSHRDAHVQVDECGGPEFFGGGLKLVPLTGDHGKIAAGTLEEAVFGSGVVHHAQPAGASITQATECGTLYRVEEIAAIAEVCRRKGLALHMDGARFSNAMAAMKGAPADMTWRAGVDLLSFGATKNGCIAAEALVVFRPELAESLAFRRKRAGHLFSKMRFLSAQLLAYLEGDLWLKNAGHANAMAARLSEVLTGLGAEMAHPVEANEVFARLPDAVARGLRDKGALFHPWPSSGEGTYRFITAFDTAEESLRQLAS